MQAGGIETPYGLAHEIGVSLVAEGLDTGAPAEIDDFRAALHISTGRKLFALTVMELDAKLDLNAKTYLEASLI